MDATERLIEMQGRQIDLLQKQIEWFQNDVVAQIRELRDAVSGRHPGFAAAAQALFDGEEEGTAVPPPPKPLSIGPVQWFDAAKAPVSAPTATENTAAAPALE